MMNNNYPIICKEVLAALDKVPKSQLKLIPKEIIASINLNSQKTNEEIKIKFDKFGNPILSDEAKSMILVIYQKYFLDDKMRALLVDKLIENDKEKEKMRKKGIKNDIFYN